MSYIQDAGHDTQCGVYKGIGSGWVCTELQVGSNETKRGITDRDEMKVGWCTGARAYIAQVSIDKDRAGCGQLRWTPRREVGREGEGQTWCGWRRSGVSSGRDRMWYGLSIGGHGGGRGNRAG